MTVLALVLVLKDRHFTNVIGALGYTRDMKLPARVQTP